MHVGDFQPIGHRHGRSENIAAAYDHDFVDPTPDCIVARKAQCRVENSWPAQYQARQDLNRA